MQIEFHFDFGSPNAYLSHLLVPAIERRTGVQFEYVPVLLGGVFKLTNNVSPAISMSGILNKTTYAALETQRFLQKHQISDFQFNPHFPVNTLKLMRGAVFARREGFLAEYVELMYQHMWCSPKKLDEEEVIEAVLHQSGLPAVRIIEGMRNAEIKQQLIEDTARSVEMGAFGSPTFFVGEAMFFGKDRLADVEEAIALI